MSSEMRTQSPEIAVAVNDLSKCFAMYAKPHHRLWQKLVRTRRRLYEEFWALRSVQFDVRAGEAVGILGANGAGKSTLLEIISGTLRPTAGEVLVEGRVAPLLQLGAGFHPDFTGRENVFLNGHILGLTKAEIQEKFGEIADFADIGDFIDKPIHTYSSGMYARLAFAVAISSDPEILVVDEILSVGDLLFQQKCMTRILQMRERGMTLLLVSHSTDTVRATCERALLLDRGEQIFFGSAEECVDLYLARSRIENNQKQVAGPKSPGQQSRIIEQQTKGVLRYGNQEVRILSATILNEKNEPTDQFDFGDVIRIRVSLQSEIHCDNLNVSYLIRDDTGIDLTGTMTWDEGVRFDPVKPGDTREVCFSFVNNLRPGNFGVSVAATRIHPQTPRKPMLFDQIDGVGAFVVNRSLDRPVHYKFDSSVDVSIP